MGLIIRAAPLELTGQKTSPDRDCDLGLLHLQASSCGLSGPRSVGCSRRWRPKGRV